MIDYDTGTWGVSFIFQLRGSVYLKTLLWSVPSTAVAIVVHIMYHLHMSDSDDEESQSTAGIQMGIGAYTTVLSFLLVFRTQQAYARWWEGGTLLQTLRGEWFNAFSNLLSFATREEKLSEDVERFQHLLVRLMSLLHGAAMQQVSTTTCTYFEIIDLNGLESEHLDFVQGSDAQCEIILQWIQRMVVQALNNNILPIPAPILSRVFQELSRGIVNLANARKISELPFPFPYAQMITVTLVIHWAVMPVLMGIYCNTWYVAGFLTLITVTSLWSINYVAQEIECPFGDDDNDLPLVEMQMSFNRNLMSLIMREAQEAPSFSRFIPDGPIAMHSGHSSQSSGPGVGKKASGGTKRESAFTRHSVERFGEKLRVAATKLGGEEWGRNTAMSFNGPFEDAVHATDAFAAPEATKEGTEASTTPGGHSRKSSEGHSRKGSDYLQDGCDQDDHEKSPLSKESRTASRGSSDRSQGSGSNGHGGGDQALQRATGRHISLERDCTSGRKAVVRSNRLVQCSMVLPRQTVALESEPQRNEEKEETEEKELEEVEEVEEVEAERSIDSYRSI